MSQVTRALSQFGCALGIAMAMVPPACVPRERQSEEKEEKKAEVARPASPRVAERPSPAEIGEPGAPDPASATADTQAPTAPAADADPMLTSVFEDDFTRPAGNPGLGPNWRATSPRWQISDGRLCGEGARNHPVWLTKRLPKNAVIEISATSASSDGDIKAEFWGDGQSAARSQSYTDATSYLTIFGGWQNRYHVLARIDEHAPDRREIKLVPGGADFKTSTVIPNQVYHFQVERRDGRTVRWLVDDMEILTYRDEQPLHGPGHEHFGFNDWQVRVCFDELRVTPLQD